MLSNVAATRRVLLSGVFAALLVMGSVEQAHAAGFVSPFIGYNFGGSSGCPEITNCEDKRLNYGVAVGALGSLVGFEAEFAYTDNFFGDTSNQTSNVLTLMGNFMVAPKIGPVQPYGLVGIGLIRTSVESTGTSSDQDQVGWDIGGGLLIYFSEHVGVRGEVRYYHSFQVLDFVDLPDALVSHLDGNKLDFGRAAAGVVFKF